jgi:plastocyanin
VLGLAPSAASADQRIEAGPGTQYLTTSVTMDQGERLTFLNLDTTGHDVRANALAPRGRPLFGTPVIGTGSSASVEGSQYLTTGSYGFHCSVHPFMRGTLTVTSAGRPATRPAGSDRRAPGVAVEIVISSLGSVERSGKLRVSFHTDERATVALTGTERVGRKSYGLAKDSWRVPGNRPVTVSLSLSKKAREALSGARKARFAIRASTRDSAGNQGSGGASRTLRR